jgi:hypothetical protein
MRLNILYLRENVAVPPKERPPLQLTSANLCRVYFPSRGVPYSLIIHAFVAAGFVLLPPIRIPSELIPTPEKVVMLDLNDPETMMYLPELGGGSRGMDLPAERLNSSRKEPSASPAGGSKGLSYPGPQRIISDPPEPTNEIQTILQPEIENAPILTPLIPLPNIVQFAESRPVAETNSLASAERLQESQPHEPFPEEPQPVEPQRELAPPVEEEESLLIPVLPPLEIERSLPIEEPAMVVPLSPPPPEPIPEAKTSEPSPKTKTTEPVEPPKTRAKPAATEEPKKPAEQEHVAKPVERPKTETKPAAIEEPKKLAEQEPSTLPGNGTDSRTLVALTPMPAQSNQSFEVPAGEARGRFAISPEPNPATSEIKLGSKLEIPAAASTIGNSPIFPPGNEAPGNATVVNLAPIGTTSGEDKNKNSSGIGSSLGTGSGSDSGGSTESGSGKGSGSGSGAGAGPGKGAFSGITIIGGSKSTGVATAGSSSSVKILKSAPKQVQSSYGLTVISTEDSGGGLPAFGVFAQERIYTVFLDMKKTETDTIPRWTLEFAVIQEKPIQGATSNSSSQNQQGLLLPFPMIKVQPTLPTELIRKYLQKSIIVYAVINVEGKMEQISIKDSPDSLFNEPVISALSQWTFRPASLGGKPVAVKVLLGIPLWLPE